MNDVPRPRLEELTISDAPETWTELGFAAADGVVELGGVLIRLGCGGDGIGSWSISGIATAGDIDGLPTTVGTQREAAGDAGDPASETHDGHAHPNGAIGVDHVVVVTPNFDRTEAAFGQSGMPFRRIRTAWQGERSFRQGFRRLGPAILQVVALSCGSGTPAEDPARFWGLVVIVADIDAFAERLGPDRCGEPKEAVQPGRRIATLRRAAGLSMPVAFMTREPTSASASSSVSPSRRS